ncbi:MAG: hypothetical protein MR902_09060 [Campylobacter sp.]|nr:hypothetical protein [Campylobacter sp.]
MKIALIGSGNIGSALASMIILDGFCDKLALVDINETFLEGRTKDLEVMSNILGKKTELIHTNDYSKLANFDLFVVTAGITRKAGQSRDELISINGKIISTIAQNVAKYSKNTISIIVTNPVDTLTYAYKNAGGFKDTQVIGMAGELDSARARILYEKFIGKKPEKFPKILGLHNDNMLFIYPDNSLDENAKKDYEKAVKDCGAEITRLTGTSAYFSPAAAVFKMILAIKNGGTIIASSFDNEGVSYGKEIEVGKDGVAKIITKGVDFAETIKEAKHSIGLLD